MKLQRIIEAVYFQPWNITPDGWRAVHSIVKPHILDAGALGKLPVVTSKDTDYFGSPIPKMEILPNGVAIVPIQGTLIHHATLMDKRCGACSYDDIKREMNEAMDAGVKKIVLHVDSPGGMAMGCSECAAVIDECSEFCRVEAVTDSVMASSAYDLCAGAHAIYCTSSAMVGSIGTIIAWLDQSVRFEMAGLKMEVFTSGDLKGTGMSGTTLSDEQRAYLQSRVDKYAGMFKSHVVRNRLVEDSSMRGQVFIGSDAAEVGLVDILIDDVEDRFDLPDDEDDEY